VVRAHARRLRRRLVDYYRHDGRKEPVRLELPRGSYLPQFVRHRRRFSVRSRAALERSSGGSARHHLGGSQDLPDLRARAGDARRQGDLLIPSFCSRSRKSPKTTLIVLGADYFLRDSDANLLAHPARGQEGSRAPSIANPVSCWCLRPCVHTKTLVVDGGYTGSGEAVCGALLAEYLSRRGKPIEIRLAAPDKTLDFGASNVIFVGAAAGASASQEPLAVWDFHLTEQLQADGTVLP